MGAVVRMLVFLAVRQAVRLIGLGPSPDAKDVEIAVLHHQLGVLGILHGCLKAATTYNEATAWAHHQQDLQAAA